MLSDYLYENVCEEVPRYIYPRNGKNKTGEWQFINPLLSPNLRHLVLVSICSHPGEECGSGDVFSNFKTTCVQKFTEHKIVSMNNTGGEVVDSFPLPSCCVCQVIRNSLFRF